MYNHSARNHKPRLVLAVWLLVAGPLWAQAQQAGTGNSRPTLHTIPDQQVKATGGSRFIELSGITAGDETGQSTQIAVHSSHEKLFTHLQVLPTSNGHAVLQYALKKGMTGDIAVTVTVTDNGTPAATASRRFVISATRGHAFSNTEPTLDPINDYETKSTGGGRFIELTGISAGREFDQTTTIAVNSTNNNLFDALSVQPTSNGHAIIQYRPRNNASGNATVTVTVSDDAKPAAAISKNFTISVKPAGVVRKKPQNTIPTLDGITDHTVRSAGGVRFIQLNGLTAGKETGQLTNIVVSNSNNRLVENMTVHPLSNGSALIQYGIREGASGVSRVTVTVTDDGAPAATITRSFSLTVKSPGKAAKKKLVVVSKETGMVLSGFPNPFIKEASISFSTRASERQVNLDVYDAAGVRVQRLFNGTTEAGRTYTVPVNGAALPAGIYIVRMTTARKAETLKMVLVK